MAWEYDVYMWYRIAVYFYVSDRFDQNMQFNLTSGTFAIIFFLQNTDIYRSFIFPVLFVCFVFFF